MKISLNRSTFMFAFVFLLIALSSKNLFFMIQISFRTSNDNRIINDVSFIGGFIQLETG